MTLPPQPQGMSLVDSAAKHREEEAEGRTAVDFGLHAMLMDAAKGGIFEELPALINAGIPTIKLFMAYKGTPFFVEDSTLFRMLQETKKVGMLMMVHAENGSVIEILQNQFLGEKKTEPKYHATSRPPMTETEATARVAFLAGIADAPVFVVHVSCKAAMESIRTAREQGIAVFGETCPHYLTLGVENLAKPDFEGAKYVCSPPLRREIHREVLWKAVQRGWLKCVNSDHCGFDWAKQKHLGKNDFTSIPNGAPGLQDRLTVL